MLTALSWFNFLLGSCWVLECSVEVCLEWLVWKAVVDSFEGVELGEHKHFVACHVGVVVPSLVRVESERLLSWNNFLGRCESHDICFEDILNSNGLLITNGQGHML